MLFGHFSEIIFPPFYSSERHQLQLRMIPVMRLRKFVLGLSATEGLANKARTVEDQLLIRMLTPVKVSPHEATLWQKRISSNARSVRVGLGTSRVQYSLAMERRQRLLRGVLYDYISTYDVCAPLRVKSFVCLSISGHCRRGSALMVS